MGGKQRGRLAAYLTLSQPTAPQRDFLTPNVLGALLLQIEEVNRQVTSSSQDIQTSTHQLTELRREMQNLEIELQAQLSTVLGQGCSGSLLLVMGSSLIGQGT